MNGLHDRSRARRGQKAVRAIYGMAEVSPKLHAKSVFTLALHTILISQVISRQASF
jgi:hypothetical protein